MLASLLRIILLTATLKILERGLDKGPIIDYISHETSSDKRDSGPTINFFGDEIDRYGASTYDIGYKIGHLGIDDDTTLINDAAGPRTEGNFHKVSLRLARHQTLDQRNYLLLSFRGQLANKNLDSYERLELGGAYGVRAYPQGEASGDLGYVANAELRHIIPLKGHPDQTLQLALFLDGGAVKINKSAYTTGLNTRHLYGYGIGALWGRTDDWLLRASYGWRLGHEKVLSGPDSNGMLWLQAIKYF